MTTSIDANQPETNHENLNGKAAREKIAELIEKAPAGFFCTSIQTGHKFATRPMTVQKVDDDGHLWFLSSSDSDTNRQLAHDSSVQLLFQGSPHSDYLTLYGKAKVSTDRAKIDELWSPLYKTWFTQGKDDPRITVIEVIPSDGYYWDTKHDKVVVWAKILAGAITGKTFDDSMSGKLHP